MAAKMAGKTSAKSAPAKPTAKAKATPKATPKAKGKVAANKPAAKTRPKGGTEELAWLRRLGLDVSGKPDTWRVNLVVQPGEATPPGAYASSTDTRFELWVTTGGWQVYVCHAGQEGRYYPSQGWEAQDTMKDLPTPSLSTMPRFLGEVEKRFGVTFRRDLALVRGNVPRAKQALARWLETE